MNILFRTDSSREIGSGHLRRCLTLAVALRERGVECIFICRELDGHLTDRAQMMGFQVISLPSQPVLIPGVASDEPVLAHAKWLGTDWQTDALETIDAIGDTNFDWLVVDHYALDRRWEAKMRPHANRIMVIDDLGDRSHDCDLLLDQNLTENHEQRYYDLAPASCVRLLGPRYALLQQAYAHSRAYVPPRLAPVQRILVFFGGADQCGLTELAVRAFLSLRRHDLALDVVISSNSQSASAIRLQVSGNSNITLHQDLPTLASLIMKADVAVGAAGATSWERCCLGLPSIVISFAENQRSIAAGLQRNGLATWLGHFDEVTEVDLAAAILDVLDSPTLSECSQRCMSAVDGRGVGRVISLLMVDEGTRLKARLFRPEEDEPLFLALVKRSLVTNAKTTGRAIDTDFLRRSLYRRLRDPDRHRVYVIMTASGVHIGQVRFERERAKWKIYYILHYFQFSSDLLARAIISALHEFRNVEKGTIIFDGLVEDTSFFDDVTVDVIQNGVSPKSTLTVALCSDASSWINAFLPTVIIRWLSANHKIAWCHDSSHLEGGDVCFYLSYSRIVGATALEKFQNNLVVHESDLPQGKGWSPLTWQILEGKTRIPVTLIEAVDRVDSGHIYAQTWIDLDGSELVGELRAKQANASIKLCIDYLARYPSSALTGKAQFGTETFYARRRPENSELDTARSINEQFNLLRVVDNERYPAYFVKLGRRYVISINVASDG